MYWCTEKEIAGVRGKNTWLDVFGLISLYEFFVSCMNCNHRLIRLCFCVMTRWKKCFISNVFIVCWSCSVWSNSSSSLKSSHCLSHILTTSNKETRGCQAAVIPPGTTGLSLWRFGGHAGDAFGVDMLLQRKSKQISAVRECDPSFPLLLPVRRIWWCSQGVCCVKHTLPHYLSQTDWHMRHRHTLKHTLCTEDKMESDTYQNSLRQLWPWGH